MGIVISGSGEAKHPYFTIFDPSFPSLRPPTPELNALFLPPLSSPDRPCRPGPREPEVGERSRRSVELGV